jgi:hypothetical protein
MRDVVFQPLSAKNAHVGGSFTDTMKEGLKMPMAREDLGSPVGEDPKGLVVPILEVWKQLPGP